MAQATYKNLNKDYRNMNLMQAVGIALSGWRENLGSNEYGEFDDAHKQITVNAVAKAIGERAFVGCGNLKRVFAHLRTRCG